MTILLLMLCSLFASACDKGEETETSNTDTEMYFPPKSGKQWETKEPSSLQWNLHAMDSLNDFLEQKHTKAFIILVDGKIVMESYFNGQTVTDNWEWNSAGKTLVSAVTGIAQQEDLLNVQDKASDYLGTGWTNMLLERENLITLRHLLTMTSGIDDTKQLVIKSNLNYVADAGSRWAYGNVFQKLIDVVSASTNEDFDDYFDRKLKSKIGMDGYWKYGFIYTIYHSTARIN